jgi:hypothetical protein
VKVSQRLTRERLKCQLRRVELTGKAHLFFSMRECSTLSYYLEPRLLMAFSRLGLISALSILVAIAAIAISCRYLPSLKFFCSHDCAGLSSITCTADLLQLRSSHEPPLTSLFLNWGFHTHPKRYKTTVLLHPVFKSLKYSKSNLNRFHRSRRKTTMCAN